MRSAQRRRRGAGANQRSYPIISCRRITDRTPPLVQNSSWRPIMKVLKCLDRLNFARSWMARQVEICWSESGRWDSRSKTLIDPAPARTNGIYQLTRVWANRPESLLYLGIVWSDTRTMLKRMEEHRHQWLSTLRGINYRFGVVTPVRGLTRDRSLLETIEGAMICELQPPENTSKKNQYSSWGDLVIHNRFDKGALPEYVDMTSHINIR